MKKISHIRKSYTIQLSEFDKINDFINKVTEVVTFPIITDGYILVFDRMLIKKNKRSFLEKILRSNRFEGFFPILTSDIKESKSFLYKEGFKDFDKFDIQVFFFKEKRESETYKSFYVPDIL